MIRLRELSPTVIGLLIAGSVGIVVLFNTLAPSPLMAVIGAEPEAAPLIALPRAPRLVVPPLKTYAVIFERPLFNARRQKDYVPPPQPAAPAKPQLPPLSDYRLVGLVVSPDTQRALIARSSGGIVTLRPGDGLDGRTVKAITSNGVNFAAEDREETLTFRHVGTARRSSAQANR